ncbi:hypothetical protein [Rugosimonospora africana]|uniref:PH domain-containing protein n=1 Tax=Rugosimonospora africana TaxID=556532 RepID=A0A8J3VVF9_9ACTN|nr:hypothetical protein [Rugosimonospora africana]GIH19884.1 hypothetical protein Raf01_80560 [Rugosimonospora africana]
MLDLPEGRVRLPGRQLRELRRLAAQGRPHPDRAVRHRAVAWARRPAPSPGRIAATVVTGTLGAAALAIGAMGGAGVLIVLLGLPLTLIAAALAAGPPRAALIHRINLAALLDDLAVPARPLEVVGPVRRRLPHQLSVSGVLVANAVAGAVARAYSVTLFCLVVAVLAVAVGRMRTSPALPVRLDETGLRLSGDGVGVPWTGIDAVELASSVDPFFLGVRWRLPVQAPPGRIPAASGGRAPGSGRPLELWLDPRDHPPEAIVLTSRAYLAAKPTAEDPPPIA